MQNRCMKGVMWMPWTLWDIKIFGELSGPLDIHYMGLFIGEKMVLLSYHHLMQNCSASSEPRCLVLSCADLASKHRAHVLFISHFTAIKPQLKQQLRNEEVEVGGTARLRCEISISKAEVEWRKDGVLLHSSSKYEMWQDGTLRELRVHHLEPGDAGEYSCKAGDQTSSAKLTVKGKTCLLEQGDFSL